MASTSRTFDSLLQLHDGVAAITADGVGQVSGADQILDFGDAEIWADTVVDLDAITTGGATGETYILKVQGSNSATFASGVVDLAALTFGDASQLAGVDADMDALDRYVFGFRNERAGTVYRYVRLFVDVAGTAPSIDFTAYVGVAHR